jgi:putative ATP-dependent endonuclease of OLD family
LDVTKSQLFFAKGVILVEGISEALLLPVLARRLAPRCDLEHSGVEIVNINGVAFEPFARLFNSENPAERLAVPCALVTDDDRHATREGKDISARAESARNLAGGCLKTFLAPYTLEYELHRLNSAVVEETYAAMHPRTEFPKPGTEEERALAFIGQLGRDKAQFAQQLAQKLADCPGVSFQVPEYIAEAIRWATGAQEKSN